MNDKFIRDRISILRTKKGISEYKMSLDLGHSKSYVQSISAGRALPSLSEFLYICEYLGVTPKEFFDEETKDPQLVRELYNISLSLEKEDLEVLLSMAKRLKEKNK
ncbi:MAG TPA: helix-turn-helix transcriptional regulator [Candidatus Limousia pullorum]|uniref:Helix-turn-helix transcriptional regulator n=1 Tax=Candidatus Limousia pullorum TaxID=2840860 RepID=A0A9D1LXG3_9FIRM|nr:helix-turn-helix transcriptional regulator [Anaeromassilibacillus sp. An172]MEE0763101.1 helix-turn-helix transcriptional regulator [Acutalibacteraceae bacterium]OUP79753.1 transcriptional regulator [Anaeromassilibacillus sp. An172]HIU49797.1 helix-turn-helix transcriptional regulator [Candidatus Limousia pullorum]